MIKKPWPALHLIKPPKVQRPDIVTLIEAVAAHQTGQDQKPISIERESLGTGLVQQPVQIVARFAITI